MLREFARHGVLAVRSKRSTPHNATSETQYPNIVFGGEGGPAGELNSKLLVVDSIYCFPVAGAALDRSGHGAVNELAN